MDQKSIAIIGIGDAGCKMVDGLLEGLRDKPSLIVVNTDAASLGRAHTATRVQIGSSVTQGTGAGGDVNTGRRAAGEDVAMVSNLFTDVNLAILVTGLGGGTGSGATPVVLKAARDAGALTVCLATLPFTFEGEDRSKKAMDAAIAMQEHADSLVLVHNERLLEFTGEEDVPDAFQRADEVMRAAINGIWRLVVKPGYISLDLGDLERLFEDTHGTCAMGYGEGVGLSRANDAIVGLLDGPLLDHGTILEAAHSIAISIAGGPDLKLAEVGEIMNAISSRVGKNSRIAMGTVVDEALQGRVMLTVLASDKVRRGGSKRQLVQGPGGAGRSSKVSGRGKGSKSAERQAKLKFPSGKGRFEKGEATILDGEDLDIPTFLRRGVEIER